MVQRLLSGILRLGIGLPRVYPHDRHRHGRAPGAGLMTPGAEQRAAELDAAWGRLMVAAQGGNRVAYERLLRDCVPLIRRVARSQRVHPDTVDDVVQDVLLTVHRALQTYDPLRSFSAWLAAIAQRRSIDALRRHGRRDKREVYAPIDYENHADATATWHEEGTADMRGALVRIAVDELPAGQREAIELLAMRQLSLDEAARSTGKTTGALKVNMHRALRTLRTRFGGNVE